MATREGEEGRRKKEEMKGTEGGRKEMEKRVEGNGEGIVEARC